MTSSESFYSPTHAWHDASLQLSWKWGSDNSAEEGGKDKNSLREHFDVDLEGWAW